jgi:hypothetical protein
VEIETSAYKKVACCLMFPGDYPRSHITNLYFSRVEIETSAYKKVACCLMFPSDYPRSLILVELKSKTLAARLLTGLTRVAEDEARKFLGRPQVS